MKDSDDDTEIKDRRLCSGCIGEAFLRAEIEKEGESDTCHYCGNQGLTISIDEMADRIETVFEQHYQCTATEPSSMEYAMIKEGDYGGEREGEPVVYAIGSAAEIDEAPAEDIRRVLEDRHGDFERDQMGEEGPFDEGSHYIEKEVDDIELQEDWRYFEDSLKTEARFFNGSAEAILKRVFAGLADHKVHDGKSIIVEAGPGTYMPALFRARTFQSMTKLEEALKSPDRDIGSPPVGSALAGRMNARGISVFYGATNASVAIGEVRPPVGSRVVVGQFELVRKLRLLDVNALRSVYVEGSVFDAEYIGQLERARFLGRLSNRITMPVMPDDEPLDYLTTQTIADYLANKSDAEVDGIIYPSAQGSEGGANVVLFHKAARVAAIEMPEGAEIDVQSSHHNEEGFEEDYWIWETVPPKLQETSPTKPDDFPNLTPFTLMSVPHDNDLREATLRLDLNSLTVHCVTAAKFETYSHTVHRHRSEKRESRL